MLMNQIQAYPMLMKKNQAYPMLMNQSPGQATIMLGLLKYPYDFSKAQGLNQLWCKGTAKTASKADKNGFSARHAYLI